MRNKITIIIPVRFRQYTLPRLLNYYKGSNLPIIICDATEKPYQRIQEFPWVEYWHKPNCSHVDFMVDVLSKIDTEYNVNLADDDFLLIPAIDACVSFLEENPSYSAVIGQEAALYDNYLEFESDHFILEQLESMNFDNPKQRMEYSWKYFTAKNHAIIRTKTHLKVFKFMQDNPHIFAIRFLDKVLSLILAHDGNIGSLPIFYNLRSGESRTTTMRDHVDLSKEIKSNLRFEKDFLKRDLTPLLNTVNISMENLIDWYYKLTEHKKSKKLSQINAEYHFEYPNQHNCKYPIKMRKCQQSSNTNQVKIGLKNIFPIFNNIDEINKIISLIKEYPL